MAIAETTPRPLQLAEKRIKTQYSQGPNPEHALMDSVFYLSAEAEAFPDFAVDNRRLITEVRPGNLNGLIEMMLDLKVVMDYCTDHTMVDPLDNLTLSLKVLNRRANG
jgi:hypothetical protein